MRPALTTSAHLPATGLWRQMPKQVGDAAICLTPSPLPLPAPPQPPACQACPGKGLDGSQRCHAQLWKHGCACTVLAGRYRPGLSNALLAIATGRPATPPCLVHPFTPAAMVGTWKKGPGVELFKALEDSLGSVPILAGPPRTRPPSRPHLPLHLGSAQHSCPGQTHVRVPATPTHPPPTPLSNTHTCTTTNAPALIRPFPCNRGPGRHHPRRGGPAGGHRRPRHGGAAVCLGRRPHQHPPAAQHLRELLCVPGCAPPPLLLGGAPYAGRPAKLWLVTGCSAG